MKEKDYKKALILFSAIIIPVIMQAGIVSEQEALLKARQFMPSKSFEHPPKTNRVQMRGGEQATAPAYYIFNADANDGFVIVSADDRTDEILAFSDSGSFEVNNMPSNVKAWLSYYEQTILSLGDNHTLKTPNRQNRTDIVPLVKTTWGQREPYNNECAQFGPQIVTGCVATAMAQVINYNKWPITTTAAIPAYTSSVRQLNIPEQPITSFDWDNMDDSGIAKLMMYCGVSVKMDYMYDLSGASAYSIAPALKQYFGYDQNTRYVLRSNYGIDEWEEMIYSELSAERAVIYDGIALNSGHEFICDGYKDGLFHINWGWDGLYNGYYSLSILNPNGSGTGGSSSNDGYSINQGAIIGIQKPSGITPEGAKTLTLRPLSLNDNGLIEVSVVNTNAEAFNGKIGIALYHNDTFNSILQTIDIEADCGDVFGFMFDTETLSGLSDNCYKLFAVFRANDTNEWTKCDGTEKHYIELIVSNGTPSLVLHPAVDLTVNGIVFSEGKHPSGLQNIIANITNNSNDEYNSSLALYVNGQVVSATGAFIRAGETEDIVFRYAPIMGNLNLQVKTEAGVILYEETVPVFNEGYENDPFFNLADNQMIFGHYNTHDYNAERGLPAVGKFIIDDDGTQRMGLQYGAVKFLANKMATIKGRKITHVRFALCTSTGVGQVKIMIGSDLDNWNILIQDVPTVKDGWNTVKLNTPITVDGSELCIGLQLYQEPYISTDPMSYVNGSSPGSCFTRSEGDCVWENLEHVSPGGSLSLQCLVEGDIPDYDIELLRYYDLSYNYDQSPTSIANTSKYVRQGTEVSDLVNITAKNIGKKAASKYSVGWQIDDGDINYEPEVEIASDMNISTVSYTLPSNLPVGKHVVSIFVSSINGMAVDYPQNRAIKVEYKVWSQDIGRQKTLIDFQASTGSFETPYYVNEISRLRTIRDDVVLLTTLYPSTDNTFQLFGPMGWPWLSINRDARPGQTGFRLHSNYTDIVDDVNLVSMNPSFATVNISAYVNVQKQLEIKISGLRNDEYDKLFNNTYLTVVLTEDRVKTAQLLEYDEDENYLHDGVLRKVVSATWGDEVIWNGKAYEKTYTLKPSIEWNLENVNIVAFLSENIYNYTNAYEVDVINCNSLELKTLDLNDIDREETRLKYDIIGENEVSVRMRDEDISGDVIIPSEVIFKNKAYKVTQIGFKGFLYSKVRNVYLPNGIETINDESFYSTTLESINIPISVKQIGYSFVDNCKMLKSITLESGNSYFALENNALVSLNDEWWGKTLFAYPVANEVTEYVVPDDIETIYGGFKHCTTLNKITLPEGLKNLYESFSYCENLKEINIPSSLQYQGSWSFAFTSIEEYTASSSLEILGSGNFIECRKLKKVSLKDSHISRLYNETFSNCVSLEEVSLPGTVAYIDVTVFRSCYALRTFYVYNPIPPVLYTDAVIEDRPNNEFEDAVYANATLYVPRGSLEAYCNAPGWNKFARIEEFDLPKYALKYLIDGEVYKTDSVRVDSTIEAESAPSKEGYTFSGWSEIPQTMPANDVEVTGSFSINSYILTYKIDREVYHKDTLNYATAVTPLDAPTKEGYTFSGWSEIPQTMPANDVIVNGSFSINSYVLTYKVDGEAYRKDTLNYAAAVTPLVAPTKEGYTFSGWSEIPATMPANSVEVIGTFVVNKYLLQVLIDGEVVYSDSITYGTRLADYVDLIKKQGIDISQWEWHSQIETITMPAHDVVINAVRDAALPVLTDPGKQAIYDLTGKKIKTDDISALPAGIYIHDGKKFIVQ